MVAKSLSEIKDIAKKYAIILQKNGIEPQTIILFGSYSKGHPKPYSDIDLVVISKDLARFEPLKRLERLSEMTIDIDAPLEVLGYTPREISGKGKKSIIWSEIKDTGKVVYSSKR